MTKKNQSELFQNPTEKWLTEAKSIPLTHICMTDHLSGLI
jgi:hypothetical protein